MLTIDVNLLNNPVLITCPTQRLPSERRDIDFLTGYVLLTNPTQRRVCIGGVKVVWQVTVEQARFARGGGMMGPRVEDVRDAEEHVGGVDETATGYDAPNQVVAGGKGRGNGKGKDKSKGKGKGLSKWCDKVVIDEYETDVVSAMWLEPGQTRLEFGFCVRPEIELSRITRFDRIKHTLYGTILTPPPGYASLSLAELKVQSHAPGQHPRCETFGRGIGSGDGNGSGSGSSSCPSSAVSLHTPETEVPPYEATSSPTPVLPTVIHDTPNLTTIAGDDEAVQERPLCPAPACPPGTNTNTAPGLLAKWKNRLFAPRRGLSLSRTQSGYSSASESDSESRARGKGGKRGGRPRDGEGREEEEGKVLASCERVVPVWSLDISGEYHWTHSQVVPKMAGVGVRISISSEALVLGGAVTFNIHLTSLPANMTVHAVSFSLIQRTRAPRTQPGSDEVLDEDKVPFVIDEWTLGDRGKVPYSQLAGRRAPPPIQPSNGDSVEPKKGLKGKEQGKRQEESTDLWRHGQPSALIEPGRSSAPADELTLSLSARLPSPLLGSASTTEHPGPSSVSITHDWSLAIHFSQLGTDAEGVALTDDHYAVKTAVGAQGQGREKMEGAVRSWTLSKGVVVGSDLAISPGMVAPIYGEEGGTRAAGNPGKVVYYEDTPPDAERGQEGTAISGGQGGGSGARGIAQRVRSPLSVSHPDPGPGDRLDAQLAASPNVNRSGFGPCAVAVRAARERAIAEWRDNASIALPQKRSHVLGSWTFLRALERGEKDMRRMVLWHWEETGGLCACFRDHTQAKGAGEPTRGTTNAKADVPSGGPLAGS